MSHVVPARRLSLAALALGIAAVPLPAQQLQRIQNRSRPDTYLHTEQGAVQAGPIQPGWWSADWIVEPVAGEPSFVRLRNRFRPDDYVHIEHGPVTSGPLGDPGWHSAQWTVDRGPGAPWVRLRNRWRSDLYLHIEHGRLEAGRITMGWRSAQWAIVPSPNAATATTGAGAAVQPGAGVAVAPKTLRPPPELMPARAQAAPAGPPLPVDPPPNTGSMAGCPDANGCSDPSDGLRWRMVRPGTVPGDAYEAGWEPADGARRPLYLCRAHFAAPGQQWPAVYPGKTARGFAGCNVPLNGREVEVTANAYEVLVTPLPGPLGDWGMAIWVGATGGAIPRGRWVQGLGEAATCRGMRNGGLHPGGRMVEGRGCAIGFGGAEVMLAEYEVLIRGPRGGM